ncbi:MAG TPA: DNA-3-methyladenine glycosylase [Streptosporangiaceae bacterium]|nr:DNA-3-methyladenine glycosylase [Streptosporangiaceae bacterium]
MARAPLPREFFARPATEVAPLLLRCVLAAHSADGLVAAELTEVEAYTGRTDPASHAFRGKTTRNEVMFGEPGHAYVYFTYGMHFCVNLVCQPAGEAAAVLLRAGRIVDGAELAAERRANGAGRAGGPGRGLGAARPVSGPASARRLAQLASGPARLCQALGITRAQNGADVCDPAGKLRIYAGDGEGIAAAAVASGPRVGVSRGAEVPWRFWIEGDSSVSAYRPHVPRRRSEV